jgi:type I restriction enzyme R subunit
LEDSEFDGNPANKQKPARTKSKKRKPESEPKPIGDGVEVVISATHRYVCLADGRKIPFDEYAEQSRDFILNVTTRSLDELLEIWIDKQSRQELREEMRDQDIYPAAFRHYLDLPTTDDVDILAKIGFNLIRVPTRHQRVARFWEDEEEWLQHRVGFPVASKLALPALEPEWTPLAAEGSVEMDDASSISMPVRFWQTALDHYALFGIDDLEQARTYSAPQFADQFGSFQTLSSFYGSAQKLKADLEAVKQRLYVAMTN